MTAGAENIGIGEIPRVSPSSTTSESVTAALADAIIRLARGEPADLTALLHDVESNVIVDGTNVTVHCHCLTVDGNGRPRVEALVEAVAEHVLDYAIPRSELSIAKDELDRSGSSQKLVRLDNKARQLFTDLTQSGEGGELLLFALAEKVLRLPQLICKMSLKTNARMHIHGADGLHVGIEKTTGKLLLYWGESKIYRDAMVAIRDCLASLAPMLLDHEASKRDLQLLQRHLDVDDAGLEDSLRKFLNPDDPAFNSLEFRGLCLVGFDCDAYPDGPSKSDLATIVNAIMSILPTWKKHVAKRVSEEKLDAFSMHFLLLPFPSAENFRNLFRKQLGLGAPTPQEDSSSYPTPISTDEKTSRNRVQGGSLPVPPNGTEV
jgi:hypothetical protein